MKLVADEVISIHTNDNSYHYRQIYSKHTYVELKTKINSLLELIELTNEEDITLINHGDKRERYVSIERARQTAEVKELMMQSNYQRFYKADDNK